MDCHNHAGVAAVATCAGCAEPFCGNCLVDLKGAKYCASCKTMAVPADAAPILHECKDASEALKFALIGIVCFGIVLEPIAISKAIKARAAIAADPTLGGSGKATAAIVIAVVVLVVWVIGMYARFSAIGASSY